MSDALIEIVLLGQPVPWARSGGHGKIRFTPTKQRNNAATLRMAAQQAMNGEIPGSLMRQPPFDTPVRLEVVAEFQIPASWSKKKQLAMLGRPHGQKPDLDNIVKQVKDACKSVVYRDDALVAHFGNTRKVWGCQPKLSIIVSSLD